MSQRRQPKRTDPASPSREGTDRPAPGAEWTADELLSRCLAHDPAAWEEFVRRYGRLIYSTIAKVGLPPDEQEEAFQASIVAIYQQLATLRERSRLIPWMIGIAWRQSINRIRRRSRETRMEEVDDGVLSRGLVRPNEAVPPDEELARLEQAQQAREALETLSERCRRLLGYFFYEDPAPDYAEIARRESLPIGSLGPTRARCLEKMRRYFLERGWTP